VRDEEQREMSIRQARGGYLLTPEMASAKHQLQTQALAESADPDAMVTEKALGKRKVDSTDGDDVQDLMALYQDLPATPEAITEATQRLRMEIMQQRQRRKDTFDQLVTCQAEAGTSSKMNDYRKLLEIGCGGISASEVDDVVANLLESLEEEEPSSSAAAWVG
jgi:transcription factor MBP1